MRLNKVDLYEIKTEIGRGGMATVYRAYDPRFDREVAIKVLPSELLHVDPEFRLRFEREIKIIARLEHSSIVPVYDVGQSDSQPYFVMRYMGGGSLSDRISAGVMDVEEAARILSTIALGLDEAHSKGIVHRDIKPSNILFDTGNNPYLSDFGIAKLSQTQTTDMTGSGMIGTPAYMAPEQAQGDEIDGRADLYSLGIVLFEMLTGKQPYEANTPLGIALKHINDPVPRILTANPNLPAGMEALIQKAMAKNKNDRYPTADDMTRALTDVVRSTAAQIQTNAWTAMSETVMSKATFVSKKPVLGSLPAKKAINPMLMILLGITLMVIITAGRIFLFNGRSHQVITEPLPSLATSTSALARTTISAPTSEPTGLPIETLETPTVASTHIDLPVAPTLPILGKVDKIAFVRDNEIWSMNVDGKDLKQLTWDGGAKNDLQWLDHNTLLFLSDKTVKYYLESTGSIETLTSFPAASRLDAFQVSHDGSRVIIAMDHEVFVVPFSFETMKHITTRAQLQAMQGACILPTPKTKAGLAVEEARWSADDKQVAWLFLGRYAKKLTLQAEQIGVFDIPACRPEAIEVLDYFPAQHFEPVGYKNREIPDFDWDGQELFTFNTNRNLWQNDGWGELYVYNGRLRKENWINPIGDKCCYRDARWSPDGTYLFFAFQDRTLGAEAPTTLYFIPSGELENGENFQPLPLEPRFFKNREEAPQPALRPAE
jgi:serine/threonine protein kinase